MDYDFYLDKILYNYLSIENDFIILNQYISLDTNNYNTFSNDLTNKLLSNCAEIENVIKYILDIKCRMCIQKLLYILKQDKEWNKIFNEEAIIIRNRKLTVNPFSDLNKLNGGNKIKSPFWWEAYNKLKHSRYVKDNLRLGNFKNVLYSLSGLYILVIYLHYIKFKPEMGLLNYPDERSRLFILKELEDNKHIAYFSEYEEM